MSAAPPIRHLDTRASPGGDGSISHPYNSPEAARQGMMQLRGTGATLIVDYMEGSFGALDWAVGSPTAPMVLDFTSCPPITTPGRSFIEARPPPGGGNLIIRGLRVRCGDHIAGTNAYGISLLGPWQNVTLERCDILGFLVNVCLQGDPTAWMQRPTIRDCVIADAYQVGPSPHSEGLYIAFVSGYILERNVIDHNGWSETVPGADPTVFRHNVYIYPGITEGEVRYNIISRGAASGLRCCGDHAHHNILVQNPVNLIVAIDGSSATDNLIIDSRDIDATHPIGTGIEVSGHGCTVERNTLMGRSGPVTYNVDAIMIAAPASKVTIRGNHIDSWGQGGAAGIRYTGALYEISIFDNLVRMPGGRLCIGENTTATPAFGFNTWDGAADAPAFADVARIPNQWLVPFAAWHAATKGPNDCQLPIPPLPTLAAFMALHGGGGIPEYLAAARARQPWVWDLPAFVAAGAQ